ncbi:hypothetical protein [Methylocystis parvus]|uniref:Uncharacterized protein n=1 Tax=Methylocystis parvus TaxID=134 RepID=A0A6B8M9S3_9HYPH|nr:hypothetical protein [Methylocystis parvus]QGM99358.1 hypothetical protein F7D14_18980 [Methylocystis parvus]WBK00249.1 hypothetical protein MMG94_00555 [Methylocystis parvus OBBP]
MAKKKSQSSRGARPSKATKSAPSKGSSNGSSKGLILALGVAIAGGAGFFLGKKGELGGMNVAALLGSEKSGSATKAASESKSADAPRVKSADKVGLARLLRGDDGKTASKEAKSADARDADPKPPADIPIPPAKPELAKSEASKPDARQDAAKPDAPEKPVVAKAEAPEQPAPLAFALLDREVVQGAEDGERVTLSLNFENLAGKPIRAFEGVMKVADQQDNNIYSSTISVSALISEGGALHWDQHVDAKKLDGKGKRLVSEDKSNLRAIFLLKRIFFVDGSVQKYAMPPRAAQAG